MNLKFWQKARRDAERELDAATTRAALDAAARKLMRAKAELKAAAGRSSHLAWRGPSAAHWDR